VRTGGIGDGDQSTGKILLFERGNYSAVLWQNGMNVIRIKTFFISK
jgi:hypothetical protein